MGWGWILGLRIHHGKHKRSTSNHTQKKRRSEPRIVYLRPPHTDHQSGLPVARATQCFSQETRRKRATNLAVVEMNLL